jgi:hypothetical protein
MKARQLTKETVTQMRRFVLMLVGETEHLEYHSVQLQLSGKIASIVRNYGLNTTVRTIWSTDHSIDDVSLYLCYVIPSQKIRMKPDAELTYIFFDSYANDHKARLLMQLTKFFDKLERIANKNPFKN